MHAVQQLSHSIFYDSSCTLLNVQTLPGIFALIVAAAGWFYIFYSQAAARLVGVEDQRLNRRRAVLRRINGAAMILMAICFYAGFYSVDDNSKRAFVLLWSSVILLLGVMLILAIYDLRLTRRLRDNLRNSQKP